MWIGMAVSYILFMEGIRTICVRERARTLGMLVKQICSNFFREDVELSIKDRADAESVTIIFVASKNIKDTRSRGYAWRAGRRVAGFQPECWRRRWSSLTCTRYYCLAAPR